MTIQQIDFHRMEYGEALDKQRQYVDEVQKGESEGVVMIVEHDHVYTIGRHGKQNNMLASPDVLDKIGATLVHVNRGGDITYHGPGQIVGYPIVNLNILGLSLREYIYRLEQVIIDTVASFGIVADRLDGATGVWIDGNRKIAAIGVHVSRGVTMHGFALNVATDLKYFSYINPCGFVDKGVTSMERELNEHCSIERVKAELKTNFERHFCEVSGQ